MYAQFFSTAQLKCAPISILSVFGPGGKEVQSDTGACFIHAVLKIECSVKGPQICKYEIRYVN